MADWPNGKPKYVTALPTSPYDGQEIYFIADATNGVIWHLRYNAGSASAYKWEYVGGSPLFSEITTAEGTTSTTYTALATAGPSVALPLAGDYEVGIGVSIFSDRVGAVTVMSYDIGGTGAVDADNIFLRQPTTVSVQTPPSRFRRKTGLTAVTLTAKYKTTVAAGTNQFQDRWMRVTPVRVG